MVELLERHFAGEVNEFYQSIQFFTRQLRESETTSAYTAKIRRLVGSSSFRLLEERFIRQRILCSVQDNALRNSFLENNNLMLKCVAWCKAAESCGPLAQSI